MITKLDAALALALAGSLALFAPLALGQESLATRTRTEVIGVARTDLTRMRACYQSAPRSEQREVRRVQSLAVMVRPNGQIEMISTEPIIAAPTVASCVQRLAAGARLSSRPDGATTTVLLDRAQLRALIAR